MDVRGRKLQEAGENSIMRSFIVSRVITSRKMGCEN
jgi:hypothetical protein